jgi:hypothetical protein
MSMGAARNRSTADGSDFVIVGCLPGKRTRACRWGVVGSGELLAIDVDVDGLVYR